jgi:hypothetical protein
MFQAGALKEHGGVYILARCRRASYQPGAKPQECGQTKKGGLKARFITGDYELGFQRLGIPLDAHALQCQEGLICVY